MSNCTLLLQSGLTLCIQLMKTMMKKKKRKMKTLAMRDGDGDGGDDHFRGGDNTEDGNEDRQLYKVIKDYTCIPKVRIK